jgi:hypothetical protein
MQIQIKTTPNPTISVANHHLSPPILCPLVCCLLLLHALVQKCTKNAPCSMPPRISISSINVCTPALLCYVCVFGGWATEPGWARLRPKLKAQSPKPRA